MPEPRRESPSQTRSYIHSDIQRIRGGDGADSIIGSAGNDKIEGQEGNDQLTGGRGNDIFFYKGANTGFDYVNGGENAGGTDQILAEADSTVIGLTGFSGIEEINAGGNYGVSISGSSADNILDFANTTLVGISRIDGGDGRDWMRGNATANVINGGTGDDTVQGGGGADTLDGGTGIDTLSYAASTAGVHASIATGGASGGDAQGDQILGFENLVGSAYADEFWGNSGANNIQGGAGDDFIIGWDGRDTIDGGAGSDTAGYDVSSAAVTVNLLSGFNSGGQAQDDLLTSIENVKGSGLGDSLTGDHGSNVLRGMNGNDFLRGNDGNDTLDGGSGADTLYGNTGDDVYLVDALTDTVTEYAAEGTDEVRTTTQSFTLGANVEAVAFAGSGDFAGTGNELANSVIGGAGSDVVRGLDGDDILGGQAGIDRLEGGSGADLLIGGSQADTFAFGSSFGQDSVADFIAAEGDLIEFDSMVFADFDAVLASAQDVGSDAVITSASGDTLTLEGVTIASLQASDFAFV